jgi:hypothetical protein
VTSRSHHTTWLCHRVPQHAHTYHGNMICHHVIKPNWRRLHGYILVCVYRPVLISTASALRYLANLSCIIESIASFLESVKDTLILIKSLFFQGPNSRDLQLQRLHCHYGISYMGLNSISLDAASITLLDSPLVNILFRFFSVWM